MDRATAMVALHRARRFARRLAVECLAVPGDALADGRRGNLAPEVVAMIDEHMIGQCVLGSLSEVQQCLLGRQVSPREWSMPWSPWSWKNDWDPSSCSDENHAGAALRHAKLRSI